MLAPLGRTSFHMHNIQLSTRHMTSEELQRTQRGFDEHTLQQGVRVQTAERLSVTAVHEGTFIGCASGLAYQNGASSNGWFYLTDLFLEQAYRQRGIGRAMLLQLEEQARCIGVEQIWTWTAGYEAPGFYQKLDYILFAEMENWYSDGSSRVGLRKRLVNR